MKYQFLVSVLIIGSVTAVPLTRQARQSDTDANNADDDTKSAPTGPKFPETIMTYPDFPKEWLPMQIAANNALPEWPSATANILAPPMSGQQQETEQSSNGSDQQQPQQPMGDTQGYQFTSQVTHNVSIV